jgi:hypothetical protein
VKPLLGTMHSVLSASSGCLSACVGLCCCRTAEGRKCRLGEGGFGVVYKAVMNGVDEVAVKLVKVKYGCWTVWACLC